jgi:hypothetical protein
VSLSEAKKKSSTIITFLKSTDRLVFSIEKKMYKCTKVQIQCLNTIQINCNIWSQVPEWARYLDIMTD